jgi:D-alanyl-D-alanine carboxypeptidase/D-alanyl-D-alanine-endopeptidase (penicillin-binding protein 4)
MTRLLALCLATPVYAAELSGAIRQAMEGSAAARSAHWGVMVLDADTGETVYQHNAYRLFVPASNVKLFSTALALARLGPDYRFTTTVVAEQKPDADGRVKGSLILVGGGDPNLSGRVLPYEKSAKAGDPMAPIDDLATQIVASGVKRVEGGVVGDDTAYLNAPFPAGWAADDAIWEYGAPVSALTLNDNSFRLTVTPGERTGDLAKLTLAPPLEFYHVDNRVLTVEGGEREIKIDREPGSLHLRVWVTIPRGAAARSHLLGIEEPALFAAAALHDALERRGVTIDKPVAARHRFPNQVRDPEKPEPESRHHAIELARRQSAPLVEDLRITNKVSQNLHAELALRAVARALRGIGSREAGLAEMKVFLAEAGAEENEYQLFDGSGLSRLNLVSPSAVGKLLLYMHRSQHSEQWLSLLPVGGEDGSLADRFAGTPAAGRVRAKTGTLSHVSALSGYIDRLSGGRRIFSILVNNYRGSSGEIRAAIDRICNLLVE